MIALKYASLRFDAYHRDPKYTENRDKAWEKTKHLKDPGMEPDGGVINHLLGRKSKAQKEWRKKKDSYRAQNDKHWDHARNYGSKSELKIPVKHVRHSNQNNEDWDHTKLRHLVSSTYQDHHVKLKKKDLTHLHKTFTDLHKETNEPHHKSMADQAKHLAGRKDLHHARLEWDG